MGLLFSLLTLPYAPVRAVTALARVLQRQAEEELYSPSGMRRRLEALDEAVARGEMSPEERDAAEQAVLEQIMTRSG